MNIFASHPCPWQSAAALDNSRVVKMVLETAQLLSTTMYELDNAEPPYRPTHNNHPCAVWARQTTGNYEWLLDHYLALGYEYTYRFAKAHKSAQFISVFDGIKGLPTGSFQPHPNCTPFKHIQDTCLAYRMTLADKWNKDKRRPSWGVRGQPEWRHAYDHAIS